MPQTFSEDYFDDTKMTFGEHLEELRWTLLKSLVALFLGFLFGLFVGWDVVAFIQKPLKASLGDYYQTKAIDDLAARLAERAGDLRPTDDQREEASQLIEGEGLLFDEVLIDPNQLLAALQEQHPELVEQMEAEQSVSLPSRKTLIPLLLYKDVESDMRVRVIGIRVEEAFFVYIKTALAVGAVVSSPFVFFFAWQFVAAGLYPHEKSYVYIFGPFSLGLFLAGASLAFFAVIRLVLQFLFGFNARMGIDPDPRISEWLGFVLLLPIGFGISFQLPLVMLFLQRIGIVTVESYSSNWRIAVMIICILSMVLTPADPGSMILMLVPLTALYFGGIFLCKYMPKRKSPFGEEMD